mmetsp:Transcript_19963/g.48157  ORF Transcript_19963/g.48157 Transcript_19963/m.48157 type:complete len:971 (-) Transcript_19963:614-3526(-)
MRLDSEGVHDPGRGQREGSAPHSGAVGARGRSVHLVGGEGGAADFAGLEEVARRDDALGLAGRTVDAALPTEHRLGGGARVLFVLHLDVVIVGVGEAYGGREGCSRQVVVRLPPINDEAVVHPQLDALRLGGARNTATRVESVRLTEGGAHQPRPTRGPVGCGPGHARGERGCDGEVDRLVRLYGAHAVGGGGRDVAAKLVGNVAGSVRVVGGLQASGHGEGRPHVVGGAARGIVRHHVGAVAPVRDRGRLVPAAHRGTPIVVRLPALARDTRAAALDDALSGRGPRGDAVKLADARHKVVARVGTAQVVVLVAGLDREDTRDARRGQGERVAGGGRGGGAGHVGKHCEGERAAKHTPVVGLGAPNNHVVAARAGRRVPQHEARVVEVGGRRHLVARVCARPNVAYCVHEPGNVGRGDSILHNGRGLQRHRVAEAELDACLDDRGVGLPVVVPVLDSDGHRGEHAGSGEGEAHASGYRLREVAAGRLGDHTKGALVDAAGAKDDANVVGARLSGRVDDAVGTRLRRRQVLHEPRGTVDTREANLEVVAAGAPQVSVEVLCGDGELGLEARGGELQAVPRTRLVCHSNRLSRTRASRLDVDRVGGAHQIVSPVQVGRAHVAERLPTRRPLQLLAGRARPRCAPRDAVLHLGVVVVGRAQLNRPRRIRGTQRGPLVHNQAVVNPHLYAVVARRCCPTVPLELIRAVHRRRHKPRVANRELSDRRDRVVIVAGRDRGKLHLLQIGGALGILDGDGEVLVVIVGRRDAAAHEQGSVEGAVAALVRRVLDAVGRVGVVDHDPVHSTALGTHLDGPGGIDAHAEDVATLAPLIVIHVVCLDGELGARASRGYGEARAGSGGARPVGDIRHDDEGKGRLLGLRLIVELRRGHNLLGGRLRGPRELCKGRAGDLLVLHLDVVEDIGLERNRRRRLIAVRVPPVNQRHAVDPQPRAVVRRRVKRVGLSVLGLDLAHPPD